MDRNFFLPIAVAAGVHSMLFISGPPADKPGRPTDVITSILKEIPLDPLDPEEITTDETTEKTTDAPPPPSSPEIIYPDVDPTKFVRPADLRDLIPRPDATGISRIDTNWQEAVAGSRKQKGLFVIDGTRLDFAPATRFQPAPAYPQDLKPTGLDGSVTVTFSVDVKGEVFDAVVTRASHTRFGEEALRAVKRWRFEPGIKDGKRVAFRMVQTFTFTLSE